MSDQIQMFLKSLEGSEMLLYGYKAKIRKQQAEMAVFTLPERTLIGSNQYKQVDDKRIGMVEKSGILVTTAKTLVENAEKIKLQFISNPAAFLRNSRSRAQHAIATDYEILRSAVVGVQLSDDGDEKIDDRALLECGKRVIQHVEQMVNEIKLTIELCFLPKVIMEALQFFPDGGTSKESMERIMRLKLGQIIGSEMDAVLDFVEQVLLVSELFSRYCDRGTSYAMRDESRKVSKKNTNQDNITPIADAGFFAQHGQRRLLPPSIGDKNTVTPR